MLGFVSIILCGMVSQLHLLQRIQNFVERSCVFGIAVFDGLEHPAFGGAAVDLLAIGQKAIPSADDMAHLIQRVERAGHAGKGHVLIVVETHLPTRADGPLSN